MCRKLLLTTLWMGVLCVTSGVVSSALLTGSWPLEGDRNDAVGMAEPVQGSMQSPSAANNLSPADGAMDVPRDTALTWPVERRASTYDVYFGIAEGDVNSATRTNPMDVLAGRDQAATTFDPPGSLAYGQSYYWRVDEVNRAADGTIYKGPLRSFTVEPYAYPVKLVSAMASSSQAGMGPEKTIDGSGLTCDQHGTEPTTMWLSAGTPPNWIQYQFDKVYKLHELQVWNSNRADEGLTGFGARKVTIEYSDGITWRTLGNVPEFTRAPGKVGYAANTTVSFGGVMAKYVRLTIDSTWSGASGITGLSEVRFSYVPVQAFAPQPANGATGVSVEPSLTWRPGREAGSHRVFLGTDQAAVAGGVAATNRVADHSLTSRDLNFSTTYYWKVDEVNTITYVGDVWSFTTGEYAAVDDFESYNDTDNRIYDTWVDGRTDGRSGSVVGHAQSPFAERTVVHGGEQALPLEYNNVQLPYYSEASRTFAVPQNWAAHGATLLSLYYKGYDTGFEDRGNYAFRIRSSGSDIGGTSDQCHFVYAHLDGNGSITARVDSIDNTNAWAKAGPMIRETLGAGAKNAYFAVTPGSGVSFQWRETTNGPTANSQAAGLVAPYWVRITRTGNVFRADRSADGKGWTPQGSDVTITMASSVFIGMAVTSHDVTKTASAEISNVSFTGSVWWYSSELAGGTIGMSDPAVTRVNAPTALYLTIEDTAGKSKTITTSDASATTANNWRQWTIALSDLISGGINVSAVKKITVGAGDRANPKPGGTGLIYIDDICFGNPFPTTTRATRS